MLAEGCLSLRLPLEVVRISELLDTVYLRVLINV